MKFKRIDSKMSDLSSSHDSRSHHSIVLPMIKTTIKTKGVHGQKERDHTKDYKEYKEEKSIISQRVERSSTSRFDHFDDVDDSEDYRKFNQITGGRVSITSSILSSETPLPMDCASLHLTYKQLASNSTGKGSHQRSSQKSRSHRDRREGMDDLEAKDASDCDYEEEVLSLGIRGIASGISGLSGMSGHEMEVHDDLDCSDHHLGSFNEDD